MLVYMPQQGAGHCLASFEVIPPPKLALNVRRSWKDFARFGFTHGILPWLCWNLLFFCVFHGLWNMDFGQTQALMILAALIISVGISLCFLLFVYCPTCWAKVRVFGHG